MNQGSLHFIMLQLQQEKKTIFHFCSYFNFIEYLILINGLLKNLQLLEVVGSIYLLHISLKIYYQVIYLCHYVNYSNFLSLPRAIMVSIDFIFIQFTKLREMFPSEVVFGSSVCFFPASNLGIFLPNYFSSLALKWIFLSNLLLKSQNSVVIDLFESVSPHPIYVKLTFMIKYAVNVQKTQVKIKDKVRIL